MCGGGKQGLWSDARSVKPGALPSRSCSPEFRKDSTRDADTEAADLVGGGEALSPDAAKEER